MNDPAAAGQWANMHQEQIVNDVDDSMVDMSQGTPDELNNDFENLDAGIPSLMSIRVDPPPTDHGPAEDVVLPKALEEVLARHVDIQEDVAFYPEPSLPEPEESDDDDEDTGANDECFVVPENSVVGSAGKKGTSKVDKNKKKKERKKKNRKLKAEIAKQQPSVQPAPVTTEGNEQAVANGDKEEAVDGKKDDLSSPTKITNGDKTEEPLDSVTVEYVPEKITVADLAPMYRQFYRVFEIFRIQEQKPVDQKPAEPTEEEKAAALAKAKAKEMGRFDDDDDDDDEHAKGEGDDSEKEKLSKRKMKKLTRLSVAELKQLVNRPDVVEMHDVTARDPKLLVQLKSQRNTVPVPRHWCFKRKYLQGKRGIEKPPFDLPAFIKKTGIMEMRASLQERDESKTLKAKMRERVRPKMGKIDIDYQKLHDAFFKWQTKPRMTIHGDLYYEGKEFETRLKEKKPGDLSEELRIALGMPIGPNCHKIPPPWLIAQQRYGPPPSYPSLKIPGLNAPIPEGTSFGYHAGGWGKPPVDENGKPLYGDVFGLSGLDADGNGLDEGEIDRALWGELESESEESEDEDEDDEEGDGGEDMTQQPDESGLVTPAEGLVTPSGLTSIPVGMETPDTIELRKKKIETEMEDNETPVLYQVLPEKRTDRIGASMMGSTHVYDLGAVAKGPAVTTTREGTVELALDPSELDMDNDAMAQRYEQQMREQQSHLQKEDLSDMLAEHVARQKSKRKRQVDPASSSSSSKQQKKYKEFKF